MFRIKRIGIVITVLVIVLIASSCSVIEGEKNCTIITASNESNTFFANNEDTHFKDLIVAFIPASSNGYGSVKFGYMLGAVQSYQGAVNDQGLVWDVNSVPNVKMHPHPEKPYSHAKENLLSVLTRHVSTVDEAVELARDFDFGDSMVFQIHIADSSGDAVVIGPGPNGEIAFTHKGESERYLVSTNFSLGDPGSSKCRRYDTAIEMLEDKKNTEYSVEYISEIIEAVHLNSLPSYTLYSNIVDLTNMKIYLYYMSQYSERIELDINKELAKGYRVIEMRSLFSPKTVEAGDKDFNRFEVRFTIYKIAVLVSGAILLIGVIFLIVKILRKKKKQHTGDDSTQ